MGDPRERAAALVAERSAACEWKPKTAHSPQQSRRRKIRWNVGFIFYERRASDLFITTPTTLDPRSDSKFKCWRVATPCATPSPQTQSTFGRLLASKCVSGWEAGGRSTSTTWFSKPFSCSTAFCHCTRPSMLQAQPKSETGTVRRPLERVNACENLGGATNAFGDACEPETGSSVSEPGACNSDMPAEIN